jgi:hypothetical protein
MQCITCGWGSVKTATQAVAVGCGSGQSASCDSSFDPNCPFVQLCDFLQADPSKWSRAYAAFMPQSEAEWNALKAFEGGHPDLKTRKHREDVQERCDHALALHHAACCRLSEEHPAVTAFLKDQVKCTVSKGLREPLRVLPQSLHAAICAAYVNIWRYESLGDEYGCGAGLAEKLQDGQVLLGSDA